MNVSKINRILKSKHKLVRLFESEHHGSYGIEATLLVPLMTMSFIVLLYFFFMVLTYVSYNNLANKIAQDLNMRQTGYIAAYNAYTTIPVIPSYSVGANSSLGKGFNIPSTAVTVSPSSTYLTRATYGAMDLHKQQFTIPFTQVLGVTVKTSNAIDPSSGSKLAGNIITVNINYRSMVFGAVGLGNDHPIGTMTATGYNVIS